MFQVRFKELQEFIDYLPREERILTLHLRAIVLETIPNCVEKLSYNVPYYKKRKNICFIWPASVTWGKNKSYEGVRFGFTQGYLLADELNYLDKGNRKQVYWKDFKSLEEIDADILKAYLTEAAGLDRLAR